MKIGLSSAAYYGQLETDEAAAHIAELPLDTCDWMRDTGSMRSMSMYSSTQKNRLARSVSSIMLWVRGRLRSHLRK